MRGRGGEVERRRRRRSPHLVLLARIAKILRVPLLHLLRRMYVGRKRRRRRKE